jgi:hypothetical protein
LRFDEDTMKLNVKMIMGMGFSFSEAFGPFMASSRKKNRQRA